MSTTKAITFDLWNTLVLNDPDSDKARNNRRVAMVQSFFAAGKRKVLSEPIRWALQELSRRVNHMRSREQRHPSADEIGHIVASQLGFQLSLDDAVTLAGMISSAGAEHPPQLIDGMADLLRGLKGRVKLGIISDTVLTGGMHIAMALDAQGLEGVFDHCTWSDQTLTTKPQARQFLYTMHMLGVTDPSAVVHVGDLEETDVTGAKSLGIKTVRVTPPNTPDDEIAKIRSESAADAVAADVEELSRILELWL